MTIRKWTLLSLSSHKLQMLSLVDAVYIWILLLYYFHSLLHCLCLVLKCLVAVSWRSYCRTLVREDIVLRLHWKIILRRHKRNGLLVINWCLTCILVGHCLVPWIAVDRGFALSVFHIWTIWALSLLRGYCRWNIRTANYIIEPFSINTLRPMHEIKLLLLFNIL